ncbi:aldo/keto reductase [Pilimelia columellifera]|uniref:Aldo/keto reductase n=1 Tax=Pilimelia columellifera subsp. columellifera TaxID=706583 RepID=A0ABN3NLE0_9ACTN
MTESGSIGPAVPLGGIFDIGGDMSVHRLGYGAMQLTGPGIWGPPADRDNAVAVLRRAVELGVDFIDTADSYGPHTNEDLIRGALSPYRNVTVATKGGLVRTGPDVWEMVGRPEYLHSCVELSLRRLAVERIDLWQLHRFDPAVPAVASLAVIKRLQDEGKIRHFGLSQVTVEQIEQTREVLPVATVQNLYNVGDRRSEDVVAYCEREGIGFIPWFPLASGDLARPGGVLDAMSKETGHTSAQLALAWLLRRSPVMLPIPGTSSVGHLEENLAAAGIALTDDQFSQITEAA